MKPTNAEQRYLRICCTEFYTKRTINVESSDTNLFTLVGKVRHWLRRISRHTRTVNKLLWTVPLPNFVKIGGKKRK
jgi:hypothetical protein